MTTDFVRTMIPNGWQQCVLPDFTHIVMGQSPPSTTYNRSGDGLPFFQGKAEFGDLYPTVNMYCSQPNKIAKRGATLLSVRAPVGPTNLAQQDCCIGRGLAAIHSCGGIAPKFLLYLFRSIEPEISGKGTGSTFKAITKGFVEGLHFELPPLPEQRRIVAKIEELFSELDKGIESLKAARAKLNIYHQAVLKHAFEGKLTAQWREENKDKLETPEQLLARIKQEREARYEKQLQEWKAAVKEWEEGGKLGKRPARSRMPKPVSTMAEEETDHLESLPSGWLWLTAESIGIVQLGRQRSPKNRSKDYPTKYIRAANITEQGLDLDDVLDMDFLPHELSVYRLEKGDLVLSEASGSAAQVGKPAIWDDQIPNCCFQNTVIRHQPYCRDYAVYLLWLYRFFYVSGKFAQVAGGVGINHLSAFKFAQIALPLCSLAEQQEIVRLLEERFAAIEQQEREIDSALNQAEMLRQSILKKAFVGQLVPQDPHDEPASVLLDRIRAEREKAMKNNHSKKTKKRKTTA